MADTTQFTYRNSASRLTSLDLNINRTAMDENGTRDMILDRDVEGTLLDPEQYDDLTEITEAYFDHFKTGITFDHRERLRAAACCFWNYVKDDLYNKLKDQSNAIIAQERHVLEDNLFRMRADVASIVGCTRGSFTLGLTQKTMKDHSIEVSSKTSELDLQFRQVELQGLQVGFTQLFQAFIAADESDFGKYLGLLQILRGVKSTENLDEVQDEDTTRDVTELQLGGSWNRTVGHIADTNGDYVGDYNAILGAGASAIL